MYSLAWVDLKDGRLIFEVPPGVLGFIDNHWLQLV
ncbi:MAG: hypothetical protein KDI21_23070, partial [Halieaceae bacterium]|nr:hypothetical protein [Halieaceae bacterium]